MLDVYRGKTVLLTGNTGFKGSWLSVWLRELGARVVGYSLDPPTDPSNFAASRLGEKITHVGGDVRDARGVAEAFGRHRPDMVFHLAAQAIVRASHENPKATFDTNVGGTVNVLEAVRAHPGVRVFINVTSDKCYENREWVWGYRENDPMGGDDPYSASKGCAELVFASYLRSFFTRGERELGLASVRAGNVVGGGDWARDRLVPDCVRSLEQGVPIPVRSPSSVRPWQHVLEPLSGYLCLGALLWDQPRAFSGAWNFGPRDAGDATVKDVMERLVACWGSGSWEDRSNGDGPREAAVLRLSCEKAQRLLKWRSVLTLEQCLEMTVDWYREFHARGNDMYGVCAGQIRRYREKAGGLGLAWAL